MTDKRAEMSGGDGRKKRAEIVKKVMAEKGMKMIEASKYVKEHNLYKK
jgi:coproporphyrinogen III oxidase-like Fe-S oxidoreductase